MDDLISIVIPVYNSKEYLSECINSVLNQSYKNIQLILVDDCSTDGSLEICKHYVDKDNRVELFCNEKNMGQSSSRNQGLKLAKGEWIGFADNDDILEPKMLETLVNNAKKYNVLVSGCAHNIYKNNKVKSIVNLVDYKLGINKPDYFVINAMYRPRNAWIDVWTKIYHKSLLKQLKFPDGCQMEDFFVNIKLFYQLDKFCYTDKPLYNWRVLESSQSHAKYFDNRFTYYHVCESIRKWFEDKKADKKFLDAAYTFEYCCKVQLLYDLVNTKNPNNIKLAKSKYNDVKKLSNNISVSNEFSLKSYLAYKARLLRVKLS